MRFQILKQRLLEYLVALVQNGDATERGLARQTGISQPHMHNLLKGVRSINPEIGDAILSKLGLDLLDLLDTAELAEALWRRRAEEEARIDVRVLAQRLGPGLPWPTELSLFECLATPCRLLSNVRTPVVARLAADPRMESEFAAGDLALLDASEALRAEPDSRSLWAVHNGREGLIRWVRRGREALYLISADCIDRPLDWERIPVAAHRIPEIIRARVTLLPRHQLSARPTRLPGMSEARVPPPGPN
jgi:hypothetical protein